MKSIRIGFIAAALIVAVPGSTSAAPPPDPPPSTASCVGQKVSAQAKEEGGVGDLVSAFVQILGGRVLGEGVSAEAHTHLEDCP